MPEWISYDQEPAGAISFDAELLDEAEFRAATRLRPNATNHTHLGNILQEHGRLNR